MELLFSKLCGVFLTEQVWTPRRRNKKGITCEHRPHVNIALRAWIKSRCDSFIIVADQIGKLSDTFSLNGFKNERHRRQSNAKQLQTSIRSRTTARAKEILGSARVSRAGEPVSG